MRLEIDLTHKMERQSTGDGRTKKEAKQKFIVKLLILCRSMFIISHLSRSSNNNVLSSLRYRLIKHLSSLSLPVPEDSNKSLKY